MSVADLPLKTEASKHKFRVLAGTHWDSVQDSFKLAVERFTSREENARWASQTLDKLLNTANVSVSYDVTLTILFLTETNLSRRTQRTPWPTFL